MSARIASRLARMGLATTFLSFAMAGPALSAGPGLISFGGGQFDTDLFDPGSGGLFFDAGNEAGDESSIELRLEYRPGWTLWSYSDWFAIRPFVGAMATTDGATYGLGGVLFEFTFGPFVFTPSFGAGYFDAGDGKDLGAALEFRTMFEVGYRFENEMRLTLGFSHMSNADIDDVNPGANSLVLYFHLPVTYLLGE